MIPWYIKKEDARKIVRAQRVMIGIIALALAVVNFVMDQLVVPRLAEIMGTNQGSDTWLSAVLIIGGLYISFQEPDYSRVDNLVKNYKKGEMIQTRMLMDWRYEWGGLLLAMGMIAYLVITIIMPIYSITNQF